jgi:hypothetical protein
MSNLDAALAEAAEALEACSISYILIGGLAVAVWGEPRSTLDVDLSVWADPEKLPDAVACLCRSLRSLTAEPLQFVERSRVLPLESRAGEFVWISFLASCRSNARLSYAVSLSQVVKPIGGRMIPVATVEDLVLMKLVSERQKDLDDARALIRRFGKTLDREYLAPLLTELAEALSQPGILSIFHGEG